MDYEQKYNEALERARDLMTKQNPPAFSKDLISVFPELKESEDERIRRGIIRNLQFLMDRSEGFVKDDLQERIAWLEKQGEQQPVSVTDEWIEDYWQHEKVNNPYSYDKGEEIQFDHQGFVRFCKKYCKKPADKVEPKFKVGDWLVINNANIYQVVKIGEDNRYELYSQYGETLSVPTNFTYGLRLWTINDAKDGDILVMAKNCCPFIFKGFIDPRHSDCPVAYCGINENNNFRLSYVDGWWDDGGIQPAAKEQRDLLFWKIHSAGYAWDSEKKELKKIEHKKLDADEV